MISAYRALSHLHDLSLRIVASLRLCSPVAVSVLGKGKSVRTVTAAHGQVELSVC